MKDAGQISGCGQRSENSHPKASGPYFPRCERSKISQQIEGGNLQ
jgi:hypothetical protein